MTFFVIAMIAVAVVANDTLRAYVLGLLFGETTVETLGSIDPDDCTVEYSDGVYEVYREGYRTIAYYTGVQVRNFIAYGMTVAYSA